jgi:hypothetical protein
MKSARELSASRGRFYGNGLQGDSRVPRLCCRRFGCSILINENSPAGTGEELASA